MLVANFTTKDSFGCRTLVVTPADYAELTEPESMIAFGYMNFTTVADLTAAEAKRLLDPARQPVSAPLLARIQAAALGSPETTRRCKDFLRRRGAR